MKAWLFCLFVAAVCGSAALMAGALVLPNLGKSVDLPAGVPRVVDTNGNVIYVPHNFTTEAYRKEALKLVLAEANRVAADLMLTNELPIRESNLVENFISPFGFAYSMKMIGNVTTERYTYYVSRDNKFSFLVGHHQDEDCRRYAEQYTWPISRLDTNGAYELARQWLIEVHADLAGLSRDCQVSIVPDNVYVHPPKGKFVPIYNILWIPRRGEPGDGALVGLFLPTKTLLQLRIEDSKYILRPRLSFTNLAALFPGTGWVYTNNGLRTPGNSLGLGPVK